MTNNPNGCQSFMTGLRALGDGFGFFFSGVWIALRIWYAKSEEWMWRPVAIPQITFLVGGFWLSVGVLLMSHLLKMDFTGTDIALAAVAGIN